MGKVGKRDILIRFELNGLTGASSVSSLQVDLTVILCGKFSLQCTLFFNSKVKSRKALAFLNFL